MIELISILLAVALNIGIAGFVLCKYFSLNLLIKEDKAEIKKQFQQLERLVLQVNEIDAAVGVLEAESKPIQKEHDITRDDLLKTLDSAGLFDSVSEKTMEGFR